MRSKEVVVANSLLYSHANLDSLPARERIRMSWDEYCRLLRNLEYSTCDPGTRSRIDACVLQYAAAYADVARNDQAAALAREAAKLDDDPGGEWEEHLSLANVPETCDFVVGSGGESTKDVANKSRCGRPAEWRRSLVLVCNTHAVGDLTAQLAKLREAMRRIIHFSSEKENP